eukprot:CAMPEP_0181386396 /NCGR_PEP_ID=MMETSP1106-20121128/23116_1 /TAXON_ID=81844 /ORGANISM="Mantoniella antarctica, Strain SL-175" /LENGTH=144 /DNA_ID=CAMNT_0023506611 /DNA_START=38 /DNA_END=469 /DNA_ORIENTATION=+
MPSLQTEIEAYAFRQLVAHFQARTDVQNIDVMNLTGFCRNCLSKWYFKGAHVHGLAINYDDACEVVYGEPYGDWKKKYAAPASPAQMEQFTANQHLHAKHDKLPESPAPLPMPLQPTASAHVSHVSHVAHVTAMESTPAPAAPT